MNATARRRSGVRPAHDAAQRGYTLLELMIVLAILGLLMALSWPSLRRPALRSAVQEAARQVVRDVARARAAAIESGRIMAWRWELDGQRYIVEPAADAHLRTDLDEPPAAASKDLPRQADKEPRDNAGFEGVLGADVRFVDPAELVENEPSPVGPALRQLLRKSAEETEEVQPRVDRDTDQPSLSEPVFFYPTGRADNAEIALEGPDGYRLTVRLRGLTGAAALGPLTHPLRAGLDQQDQRDRLDRQEQRETRETRETRQSRESVRESTDRPERSQDRVRDRGTALPRQTEGGT